MGGRCVRIPLVFLSLVALLAAGTVAVDLEEALKGAPQEILDIISMNEGPLNEGNSLIVERVRFSDERPIEGGDCPEVYVAFQRVIDRALITLSGGWFTSEYPIAPFYTQGEHLFLRAVGHRR